MDQSFTITNTANTFAPSEDSEIDGYQNGLGYEVKLGDVWLVRSGWSMALEFTWTTATTATMPSQQDRVRRRRPTHSSSPTQLEPT